MNDREYVVVVPAFLEFQRLDTRLSEIMELTFFEMGGSHSGQ